MNLFFIVDEWTDVSNEAQSRSMVSIILDALQSPHRPRPNNEWVGGEIARQFWQLATQSMSTPAQQRFLTTFEEYLNAVVDEAKDRSHHRIRDVRSYLKLRRNTIGAKPSFAILEAGMELGPPSQQSTIRHHYRASYRLFELSFYLERVAEITLSN